MVISSALVQKKNKVEQLVYFVRNVFKGIKERYQKIERQAPKVLITTGKLRSYF